MIGYAKQIIAKNKYLIVGFMMRQINEPIKSYMQKM